MASSDQFVSVSVKWGKKSFPDVEIDTSESAAVFKSQLWTLTGVPPERQTIIGFKGGKLKDEANWNEIKPKAGSKIILLGTPDEKRVAPPTNMPTVRNDLNTKDGEGEDPLPIGPPGLQNLENTCYANATIQCLSSVPPLGKALSEYKGSTLSLNPAEKLSASLRDVFSRLKSANTEKINPLAFIQTLRNVNPQFAERGQDGRFMQQDAEECWSELLTKLSSALQNRETNSNTVDDLFSFEMASEDRCTETDESVKRSEKVRTLKCHISQTVNHVQEGIKEGLTESIEKTSEKLGRSAEWNRVSKIATLPPFLNLQFVRFYWKASEQVKAKVLRRVSFPLTLDLYDFCSEELKEKLASKREEAKAESDQNAKASSSSQADSSGNAASSSNGSSKDKVEADEATGQYELTAVLTHKGRAADSGHYVAWVKQEGKWYQFNDDKVSVHTEEEVEKLSGGGDWHMAYILLYSAK